MAINGLGISYDPYKYFKKTQSDKTDTDRKTDNVDASDNGKNRVSEREEAENNASGLKFGNKDELMSYLKNNFKTVAKGMTQISGSYLSRCLKDENELQKLFDNLSAADEMAENAEENIEGYQGMKITIDENGEMKTETYGGRVAVNEGKRMRQIAAAKNPAQIQMVISMLNKDMSDVKSGKEKNMCDDDEIAKVEALLQQAQQRAYQIQAENNSSESKKEENENDMSFYTTLLM